MCSLRDTHADDSSTNYICQLSRNKSTKLYVYDECFCFFLLYTPIHVSLFVFTARGYAKRGICRRRVSVCVCLSHFGIVSKRLNVGSRKQRRTIAP